MTSLAIGVDNIHHDVYLSPRFLQLTRDYLFDLIRQTASRTICLASNCARPRRSTVPPFANYWLTFSIAR